MILRLPIVAIVLMTVFASRCDNLHARSQDAALAAYEASVKATHALVVCDPDSYDPRSPVLAVCESPSLDQARR